MSGAGSCPAWIVFSRSAKPMMRVKAKAATMRRAMAFWLLLGLGSDSKVAARAARKLRIELNRQSPCDGGPRPVARRATLEWRAQHSGSVQDMSHVVRQAPGGQGRVEG